jgi:hypothetical protein|nr:hypothetical protein [uncultured Lachnoclostridium sp.]
MAEQQKVLTQRRFQAVVNKTIKTRVYKDNLTELTKTLNPKWSPHNKRALIFDALGFGYINFKTNAFETKLMGVCDFKEILPPTIIVEEIQQGRNPFKSTRPMINAIIEPYKMSNVEEIVFHKGNFAEFPYDMQFELQGIQAFLTQKAKTHCVRLQWYIEVEQGFSFDLYQGYNPEKQSILSFFKEKNVTCKVYELQPERNAAGYLTKYVLNSGNYKYDAKYDPNDKSCKGEEYSLSKYFYEYDLAAKKALDEMQKSKDKKEEQQKKPEEDVVYDAQVESAVNATLSKLETFYTPLWDKKYDAIFCETGLKYTVSGRNIYNRYKSLVDAMYSAWKEIANVENVADVESPKFTMKDDFSPGFHHAVLNDRVMWASGKGGQPAIKKQIYKKYLEKYNEYYSSKPEQLDILERNLTNCFVVKKWGKNDVLLRFTGINPEEKAEFERVFSEKLAATYRGGSMAGMVASCVIDSNGVGTLTYIINWQEFLDEILFAHKQYTDYGVKPSLTEAVLGLRMDGKPLTVNLIEANKILTTILAGSGSGKGVMTMSLLASLFGAGGSVVYLDYKPDIAGMLWDLEREYAGDGLKLLALDVGKEKHETTGSTPIRTGPLNLLPEDEIKSTQFRTLRLSKLFQLVTLVGKFKSDIEVIINTKIENLFFIIDELTSFNTDFTDLVLYVEKKEAEYRAKAGKTKATEEEKKLFDYYTNLNYVIKGMNTDFVQGVTKDWRMSGLKVIIVGQELGTNWKVGGKGFATSFAGRLLAGTHKTISGVAQANENTFDFSEAQAKLAKQRGVFAISDGIPSAVNSLAVQETKFAVNAERNFKQFRSFFSLVKNDFDYNTYIDCVEQEGSVKDGLSSYVVKQGGKFTTQLLSGFLDKSEQFLTALVDEFYDSENSCNKDEISFSGLLKVMQEKSGISKEQLIANMGKGYDIFDKLFKALGLADKYTTLEEYLCDCSPEGIFTLNELMGILGLAGGTAPKKKVNNTVDIEEELNFFNDSVRNDYLTQNENSQFQQQTARPQAQKYTDVHREGKTLDFKHDPIKANHTFIKSIDAINAMKTITKYILKDINKYYGGVDGIKSFTITDDGILIFNEKAYAPRLDEKFVNNFEDEEIRTKLKNGYLADLFFIKDVFKFKNLKYFEIEDEDYANDTVRLGLGIKGKPFSILYDRFPKLKDIIIGGIPYVRGNVVNQKEQEFIKPRPRLADLRDTASAINNYQVNPNTLMGKVWNSKPAKTLFCAFGWTMGAQVVFTAATLFGPIGLLFGAFALSKAYSDYKKEHPDPPQKGQKQRQKGKGNYTRDYQYDDYDDYDYDRQGRRPNHNVNYRNNQNGQSRSNNNRNNRQHNSYYK